MKFPLHWFVASIVAAALLTSCASERVKAANKKAKEDKDEYVYVYHVGSNIPEKVKKKDLEKTSDKDTEKAQEVMREVQRNGSRAVSDRK